MTSCLSIFEFELQKMQVTERRHLKVYRDEIFDFFGRENFL
jgi:hypothetical protein